MVSDYKMDFIDPGKNEGRSGGAALKVGQHIRRRETADLR